MTRRRACALLALTALSISPVLAPAVATSPEERVVSSYAYVSGVRSPTGVVGFLVSRLAWNDAIMGCAFFDRDHQVGVEIDSLHLQGCGRLSGYATDELGWHLTAHGTFRIAGSRTVQHAVKGNHAVTREYRTSSVITLNVDVRGDGSTDVNQDLLCFYYAPPFVFPCGPNEVMPQSVVHASRPATVSGSITDHDIPLFHTRLIRLDSPEATMGLALALPFTP